MASATRTRLLSHARTWPRVVYCSRHALPPPLTRVSRHLRGLAPDRQRTPSHASSVIAGRVFPALGLSTGHVYATYSALAGRLWDHIIAATLESPYALTPAALVGIQADAPGHAVHKNGPAFLGDIGVVAYSLNATTLDNATLVVQVSGRGCP